MSFKDLSQEELYRTAIEDFAVDVEPTDSAETIRAAFLEQDITWDMYVKQHPELEPVEEEVNRIQEADRGNVIKAVPVVTNNLDTEEEAEEIIAAPRIRTKEKTQLNLNDQYLLKMTRDNTMFETRGYRFTQDHPYALVSAVDAEYILENEDGFRQAFPSELEKFYS
jgi:hypothetical protein